MPKPSPAPDDVLDPVASARNAKPIDPDRLMMQEPLRTWLAGLLELKADRGRKYSWGAMHQQLAEAAQKALSNPKTRVVLGGTTRALTIPELRTLHEFSRRGYSENSISYLARISFPELWAKVQSK